MMLKDVSKHVNVLSSNNHNPRMIPVSFIGERPQACLVIKKNPGGVKSDIRDSSLLNQTYRNCATLFFSFLQREKGLQDVVVSGTPTGEAITVIEFAAVVQVTLCLKQGVEFAIDFGAIANVVLAPM